MKKILFAAALSLAGLCNLAAQTSNNSIVVFSEAGDKFYLILNGIKQNSVAETNVKAAGLTQANYKAKVIFDNKALADCDKTIPMMWGGEAVSNTEFVFSISKDKKGAYKWKFVSQGPVSASAYATNTATPVASGTAGGNTGINLNTNVNTNTNNNVATTTTNAAGTGTNGANISMGVNGTGISLNVNITDGTTGTGTTTTSTTTTTSYTTSTTTNGVTNTNSGSNTQVSGGTNGGNVGVNVNMSGTAGTTANAPAGGQGFSEAPASPVCSFPMSPSEFADAKKSVEAKSFEETKMTVAKQVADNNCLSVEQIKGIMALFSFEQSKLDFAKYCYTRCTDKKNYYKMSDAFSFEASTEELNEYTKGK
jgi:hypothetical protein